MAEDSGNVDEGRTGVDKREEDDGESREVTGLSESGEKTGVVSRRTDGGIHHDDDDLSSVLHHIMKKLNMKRYTTPTKYFTRIIRLHLNNDCMGCVRIGRGFKVSITTTWSIMCYCSYLLRRASRSMVKQEKIIKEKDAVLNEIHQFHDRDAFNPIDPKNTSKKQRNECLESIFS